MKKEEAVRNGAIRNSDLNRPVVKVGYIGMYIVMIAICVIMFFPILWVFMSSFKSYEEFMQIPPTIIPRSFQLSNVVEAWQELKFYKSFLNSVILTSGTVIIGLFFQGLTGYTLSKIMPKGSKKVSKILFMTMLFPMTTSLVPAYQLWVNFPILGNLTNTFLPFWIGAMGGAYNIILFKNFFDSIPAAYLESAKLDGCTSMGIYTRIIVPMSKPIFLTVGIFSFSGSWNDFLMPSLLLKNKNLITIGVQLYNSTRLPDNQRIIGVMFSIIVPIIIFCFAQKYVLNNDAMSGIKE